MFRGRRDPEVGIVVEQAICGIYSSKNGGTWVEIPVPPEDTSEYDDKWETIMVDKKQVDNLDEYGPFNYIRVNDMAGIVCSLKDDKHAVISGETLVPIQIIGRFLKYYRWAEYHERHPELAEELNRPSLDLYNDMVTLGQDMLSYMNRLPKVLPKVYTIEELAPEDPLASLAGGDGN